MQASTLQTNLGSTFTKAAFLAALSTGMASHAYSTLGSAAFKGQLPKFKHSADAAKPFVAVVPEAHRICAGFSVVDEGTLDKMLQAVKGLIDRTVPDGEWDDDEAHSRELLNHVFGVAAKKAKGALNEVASGFAMTGGELGVLGRGAAQR